MSKIQWTDRTDNPIVVRGGGWYCTKISPGCANCYAEALNRNAWFRGNGRPYRVSPEPPELELRRDILDGWKRQCKPKKHFVSSMTDVFGEFVPDVFISHMLRSMVSAPKQTFQILTKRSKRACCSIRLWLSLQENIDTLPYNIWLGASAENQEWLDKRLPWLFGSPVRVRFLSLEPLLGPIQLPDLDSDIALTLSSDNPRQILDPVDYIDWVIIGGESGPNARPMDLAWVEDILQQCEAANIPAFVKQLGSHWARRNGAKHRKGGDPVEWPEWARVREFPGEEL